MTELLSFEPINAPRPDHAGERIYTEQWAALAPTWVGLWDDDETVFRSVFKDYGWHPGQREATITASFMCWLGANVGQGFLAAARSMARAYPHLREQGYLMAWAVENNRTFGVNFGMRTLEFILTPRGDLKDGGRAELSARDLEAVDCLVRWLATARGQAFVAACDDAIEKEVLPG